MAAYLDQVPFSGIIRIRDLMYSIADPYRLDQGDVSFDSPDSVKSGMRRAIDENRTHYLQTTGVPRLRDLIAAKLRDRNRIPVDDSEHVLVTNGGIHGIYIVCQAVLEPGDEVVFEPGALFDRRASTPGAGLVHLEARAVAEEALRRRF